MTNFGMYEASKITIGMQHLNNEGEKNQICIHNSAS